MISRTFHAWLDYTSCAVLFFAPWLFKFNDANAAMAASIGAAIIILISSLLTKYEGGVFRVLPMSMHLTLDVLLGILLLASPWLLSFRDQVYWPHIVFGALAIVTGIFTVRKSMKKPSEAEHI